MTRGGRSGFSLIEALVALTIAALTLSAIFELQVQMVRGQERAARALKQVMAQENAISMLRDVNPMEEPTGAFDLDGGDIVRWSSEPVGALYVQAGFPSGEGRYRVQRFKLTVSIERPDGRSTRPLVFERVGWEPAI